MNLRLAIILVLAGVLLAGCVSKAPDAQPTEQPAETPTATISGTIKLDGSSTVFPISEAVGEEFQKLYPNVRVTVGISGTGGGFKKFCAGETDISDASRPIKGPEISLCANNSITYEEFKVAFDGLSVMVNPQNTWVDYLTVAELKKIWEPDSTVKTWRDVRPDWPNEKIILVGADTDSGTFDYFTDAIVGKEKSSRSDYTASADDNVLVQAIAGEKNALGYFGYAYYVENPGKLKLVAIDGGKGQILPSEQTINDGTYKPLSRPLFIYANKESLKRTEVKEFVKYYLTEGKELVSQVGYVKMPDSVYEEGLSRLR
ncbi:PstS family phosphate ABC transporter substrate-binding protein [Candidatus Methanoperedens nitratireducens]|uniref:Protein SphX n=1 Tax=Candidatus Methanoperedens nitratireducens TaxID=1392998 RepID=A0A284VJ70_9EURY|nr:PstS family phosphate ABC transporter substrate-binding protein [Candidatus Methanoperedens nitroreducens]SNQ59335.1 Protein SphX [Candidatus Methanoperedens nitroreducens]